MLLLGMLSLAGCATMPAPRFTGPAKETIYVIGRGWHTEIGLDAAALDPPLLSLAARYPGAQALSFGFGDRAYVLARNKGIGDALGALLPNRGLILVTLLNTSPPAAFGTRHVIALPVTHEGLDAIADDIWDSLATDHGHLPAPYGAGPYSGSVFYASRVRYDGFYTCNTWVAAVLRAGGLPFDPAGVLFASQVMYQARMAAKRAKSP
ncbi:MAG TPA: DUF2459 domain-containing protein [Acetobacteraceae bacterium]|nr:DUF2459 domain-containing protein [Acetobacteraceae bacterium]